MAKFVWSSVRLLTAGADLTTVNNKIEVKAEVEAQDSTAFTADGNLWKEVLAGLRSAEISAEGQWEAGDLSKVDDASFGGFGAATPWTIAPDGAAVSSLAYLTSTLRTSYELGGTIGDVAPWKADGNGTSPLVRGVIGHPPGTARTASGTGTAIQLGAVSSSQALYAALHVHSISGTSTPTITARIESDDSAGFASATTVGTFTAATALGGEWMRVAGPITDTHFRVAWTISGSSPSFLFTVSLGIA